MSDNLKIECVPGPGQFGGYSVTITPEIAKNLVMLAASHETGPNSFAKVVFSSGEKVTIGPDKPAAPVDDGLSPEAAAAIKRGCEDSLAGRVTEADFSAHASNADEVDEDMLDEMIRLLRSERDTLKAEVERLRAEADCGQSCGECHQCLSVAFPEVLQKYQAAIARAEAAERNRCDHCGANLVCDCRVCGAPNCCPQCCAIDMKDGEIKRTRSDLAAATSRAKDAEDWIIRLAYRLDNMGFYIHDGTADDLIAECRGYIAKIRGGK